MQQAALLDNRGMIEVTGDDALSFLQGIITNDVHAVATDKAIYSCFLTPQGKYLADFFMYPHKDGVLLDVDKALLQNLLKRMSMFRLRSKVSLVDVSDQYTIHAVWGCALTPDIPNVQIYADPRASVMGYRVVGTAETQLDIGKGDYALWQMQNGIADWSDFERERTAMLEANMDLLNALSWTKGCYMGQELTARTHYRGLTKRRFFAVKLPEAKKIETDTPVTRDGKTIGFVRGRHGHYVLAHLAAESVKENRQCEIDGLSCDILVPDWLDLDAATAVKK